MRLDGQNLATLDPGSLRRFVGVVSPDLALLRASLGRNLRYRHRNATAEEVRAVLAICDLEADIAAMPAGLETRLAEGGAGLPAGLRRRIALARAVLGRPRLLLVDEMEAFVDARSRAALERVLAARRATTLVVAQDARCVPGADLVWRLDGSGAAEAIATPESAFPGPGHGTVIPLPRRPAPGAAAP